MITRPQKITNWATFHCGDHIFFFFFSILKALLSQSFKDFSFLIFFSAILEFMNVHFLVGKSGREREREGNATTIIITKELACNLQQYQCSDHRSRRRSAFIASITYRAI